MRFEIALDHLKNLQTALKSGAFGQRELWIEALGTILKELKPKEKEDENR